MPISVSPVHTQLLPAFLFIPISPSLASLAPCASRALFTPSSMSILHAAAQLPRSLIEWAVQACGPFKFKLGLAWLPTGCRAQLPGRLGSSAKG